jgi:beta-glucanase (GH16 family)
MSIRNWAALGLGAAISLPLSPAAQSTAPAQAAYEVVWSDEFDRDGAPDPAKWTYERGFVRNQELQWYQPDNAHVSGGLLVVEARHERKANPNFEAGSTDWKRQREFAEYTSASLTTRGLNSWQYGRFEMRGRIDTRLGLWPAFWTVGVSGPWPRNGEIDIMEFYRGQLLANLAWGGDQPGRTVWDDSKTPIGSFADPKWSDAFHVWRMDWTAEMIELSVDGQVLKHTDLSKTINEDGSGVNPFHQAHHLILNLAVGSTGGDPSSTTFPARYEVDYVRVSQIKH